jgi:sporulation protein YlmC with PRC-barrel domain
MVIPVSADVECVGGPCGHSTCVIVDPAPRQLTHLVVKEKSFPYLERLVPLELVRHGTSRLIQLGCTKSQLATLRPYLEVEWPVGDSPYFAYEVDKYRKWPYAAAEPMPIPSELERISTDELAIHRDALVKGADRQVGRVKEFLVDETDGHITHLVLREGHLWAKREVAVPVSHIDRIEEDTVYLDLEKHCIETLPAVPMP